MMFSTLVNGFLGLVMIIAYCYCVGDILEGLFLHTLSRLEAYL